MVNEDNFGGISNADDGMNAPVMGLDPMQAGQAIMDTPDPTDEAKPQPMNVDDEIRSMINSRKLAAKIKRQEKKDQMDKCWNHYNQVYDKTNKEKWQSTTFIPASPKVAEVIVSNMHSALLGPEKPVEFQAKRPEFESVVADTNDLLNSDLESSNFKVHWTDFLRTLCIIGTAIGKVEYLKEKAMVSVKERVRTIPGMDFARSLVGLPPQPTERTEQKEMLVKDYAAFKNVDVYDIYVEPGTVDFSKDRWVIEEGKISNSKLIQLANDPDPELRVTGLTEELLSTGPHVMTSDGEKDERDASNKDNVRITSYLPPDQEHILDEYWGPAPIWMVQPELYGDESRKYEMVYGWFWLIDGIHVVRKQITPWRDAEPPYVKGVYIRVPGQFYGMGPLELMIGLQIELNESRNCRQDEINVKLNKPMGVLKEYVDAGDWARLTVGPGALWPFKGTDDIRKVLMEINFDANLQDSWRGSAEIYNEIQEVTAAVKAMVGTDGGGGATEAGTFRGQLLNKQGASERFMMYARMLEITGLSDAIKKIYQRIYQFKGWDEAIQILGQEKGAEFKFVPPEILDMISKVVPNGVTSMENKGVQLAQMAEEFKLFAPFPWYKQIEAARRIVVQRGQSDPDSVIFSDDELKQYNDLKRQAAGLGMNPGAPSGPPGTPPEAPPGPIAGNMPGPTNGMPRPAMPPRGVGASPIDVSGRPLS